jgi:hypothetical protein
MPGSIRRANLIFFILIIWLGIQAALTLSSVYRTNTTVFPPRLFLMGVFPMLLTIIILFATKRGRIFIDSLPLFRITWLNTIRIAVELVLLWLFLNKAVPQVMTFEGWNFDILSGITAPIIAWLGFSKKMLGKNFILVWNIICLILLFNIVIIAVLSAPFSFQQLAFDQPNIAILYFPFSWLPAFIVPVVLFGHLVSIRQLTLKNEYQSQNKS